MTVWPIASCMRIATARPTMSDEPPATNGTSMRTGRFGHDCADGCASDGAIVMHAVQPASTVTMERNTARRAFMIFSS